MKNEKTFLPTNLGLAPFFKSRGMMLQITQLQQEVARRSMYMREQSEQSSPSSPQHA